MKKNVSNYNRVHCGLLKADIYARNAEICAPCTAKGKSKTYPELQTRPTRCGIEQVLVQVPYPITPESVKSYATSADYRNDPFSAMSTPAPGKNLGDVTALQELLSKDMESARAVYANLKQIFESAQVQTQTTENKTTTEAVNNG